jgi:transcription antitermination protein NusB
MTDNTRKRLPTAKSAARLGAVQALYQMDIAGSDVGETLAQFSSRAAGDNYENGEIGDADYKHLCEVVQGVVREQALLDPRLDQLLDTGWPIHRLDATLRAVLRAAAYEIWFLEKVPARVAISEYVDVAAAFFTSAEEPRFVNGVLNTLARQRRPDEFAA